MNIFAQRNQLQARVTELESQVAELQNADQTAELQQLQTQLAAAQGELQTAQTRITELETTNRQQLEQLGTFDQRVNDRAAELVAANGHGNGVDTTRGNGVPTGKKENLETPKKGLSRVSAAFEPQAKALAASVPGAKS